MKVIAYVTYFLEKSLVWMICLLPWVLINLTVASVFSFEAATVLALVELMVLTRFHVATIVYYTYHGNQGSGLGDCNAN